MPGEKQWEQRYPAAKRYFKYTQSGTNHGGAVNISLVLSVRHNGKLVGFENENST
jgi:hypothetical protein